MDSREVRAAGRGILLIELMMMLVIMAAVAVVVGDALAMMFHVYQETGQRDAMISRVDTVLDLLRHDVWSATAIRASVEEVELEEGGDQVTWKMGADGKLTRSEGGELPRVWNQMPQVSFGGDGALLRVEMESGPAGSRAKEAVILESQRMLAGGGP